MLDESKKVTITGTCKIDGVVCENYSATIDESNPEKMTLSRVITNPDLRKENRKQARKDQAQFEDDAYSMQDEMIQTDSKVEETA